MNSVQFCAGCGEIIVNTRRDDGLSWWLLFSLEKVPAGLEAQALAWADGEADMPSDNDLEPMSICVAPDRPHYPRGVDG